MQSLQRKHVLITGGSSGIGLEIAKEAILQGAYVTLVARDSCKLLKASDEITREEQCEKDRINIKVADVSDYEAIYRVIHEAFHWRPVDILVCNAGVTKISYLEQVPIEKVAATVGTNLTGTLYTLHAALPLMKQRSSHCHGSAIVLMGSLASLYPLYGSGIYTSTKYALRGLAESLRLELFPYKIGVSLVCPGTVETQMLNEVEDCRSDPKFSYIKDKTSFYNRSRAEDPRDVAKATLKAAKHGKFLAATSLKGHVLGILSPGLLPADSILKGVVELIMFIPVRLASYMISAYIFAVIWWNHGCHDSKFKSQK
ncbi:hypothetical protein SUGI_0097280 [Cryptomeria japonica]|uniref:uncharacterized protein LOC131062482 n=1 Tax=Cryptomeria japonica TaxID=3369 RepID=UPI002408C766|nr:uncharacterized protein LOC131062482 [Cryptomeria japonica]GLJ08863.1 hypothetical protein SUGI_0097280 [Cryptomeria japonica]